MQRCWEAEAQMAYSRARVGRAGSPLPAARKRRGTKANGNFSMCLTGSWRRRDSSPYPENTVLERLQK